MKKWIIPGLSLLVIVALIFVSSPYYGSKKEATLDKGAKAIPAIFGQTEDKEEKKQEDSDVALLLKIQEALNGWLKSINERIESKDVTKIEVRFLEILRSILEWIKEKVDAKIESSQPRRVQTDCLWSFRA